MEDSREPIVWRIRNFLDPIAIPLTLAFTAASGAALFIGGIDPLSVAAFGVSLVSFLSALWTKDHETADHNEKPFQSLYSNMRGQAPDGSEYDVYPGLLYILMAASVVLTGLEFASYLDINLDIGTTLE